MLRICNPVPSFLRQNVGEILHIINSSMSGTANGNGEASQGSGKKKRPTFRIDRGRIQKQLFPEDAAQMGAMVDEVSEQLADWYRLKEGRGSAAVGGRRAELSKANQSLDVWGRMTSTLEFPDVNSHSLYFRWERGDNHGDAAPEVAAPENPGKMVGRKLEEIRAGIRARREEMRQQLAAEELKDEADAAEAVAAEAVAAEVAAAAEAEEAAENPVLSNTVIKGKSGFLGKFLKPKTEETAAPAQARDADDVSLPKSLVELYSMSRRRRNYFDAKMRRKLAIAKKGDDAIEEGSVHGPILQPEGSSADGGPVSETWVTTEAEAAEQVPAKEEFKPFQYSETVSKAVGVDIEQYVGIDEAAAAPKAGQKRKKGKGRKGKSAGSEGGSKKVKKNPFLK
jgi:hypothetical protein